jgi:hypothetical protein
MSPSYLPIISWKLKKKKNEEKKMATGNTNVEVSLSHTKSSSSIQDDSTEQSPSSKGSATSSHFGKALAFRAVYSSIWRSSGSRKVRANDVKALPSRLSKVSLPDQDSTKN